MHGFPSDSARCYDRGGVLRRRPPFREGQGHRGSRIAPAWQVPAFALITVAPSGRSLETTTPVSEDVSTNLKPFTSSKYQACCKDKCLGPCVSIIRTQFYGLSSSTALYQTKTVSWHPRPQAHCWCSTASLSSPCFGADKTGCPSDGSLSPSVVVDKNRHSVACSRSPSIQSCPVYVAVWSARISINQGRLSVRYWRYPI